jgi:small redox-active disulfide protein 2
MKIHVLGPVCAKCTKLAESVTIGANEVGIAIELEKVTDFNQIIAFGVMSTPGLVVNGEVKSVGRIPSREEIKAMLK